MFQSIGRGWIFIKQSWLLSQKTPAVLFPTLLSILTMILATTVILVPIAGLVIYIRKNVWGQVAIGVLIGLLLSLIITVINVFSIMSSNLASTTLTGRKTNTADAWKKISDLGGDLYIMGLGLPIYRLWRVVQQLFTKSYSAIKWEDADQLLIPVLANEEITLRQTPGYIFQMQSENCVFMAEGVGIQKTNIILTAAALLVGLAAGIGAGWLILSKGQDAGQSRAIAFAVGALLTAIFTLPVVSYLAYAKTLFNTCLYLWGNSVRDARKQGVDNTAAVPDPLAAALGIRSGR